MEELVKKFNEIAKQLENLQRQIALRKISIPADGKLVVDSQAADPAPENGRVYYNTATNKFKVCENGVWKTITTS